MEIACVGRADLDDVSARLTRLFEVRPFERVDLGFDISLGCEQTQRTSVPKEGSEQEKAGLTSCLSTLRFFWSAAWRVGEKGSSTTLSPACS